VLTLAAACLALFAIFLGSASKQVS